MFSRTERVIGKENVEKLKNSNIAVLGVGGVGGYVVEMLARLGVGKLTIVDFDRVDKSNINRQILALNSTIGKTKVEVCAERIFDINNECEVTVFCQKINEENVSKILKQKFDYVIDAIDDLKAKVEVAKFCQKNNISLVSSMGTGNRFGYPKFEIKNVFDTSYDKLAKKLRKMLKDEGITKLDVVCTSEPVVPTEQLGSVVYYPLMCAGVIVSFVTNKIIQI